MMQETNVHTQADNSFTKIISLVKQLFYPISLQLLTVIALIGFFNLASKENGFSTINTGMLFFWNFWWPIIPFIVLFLGRFWCSICPFSTLANILKRYLPYRLFNSQWFYKNGLISSLFVYLLIVVSNVAFAIESNNSYSIIFISSMIGIMVAMIFLFGYKSYCYAVCPMGLFFQLYDRFSFVRMEHKQDICEKCHRHSWISEQPFFNSQKSIPHPEKLDWRYRIECLKKCTRKSTEMKFGNPFRQLQTPPQPTLINVLGPGVVITIFGVSLFEKSNFFLRYYEQFNTVYPVSLPVFHITSIPLIILFILLINMLIINSFCKISGIKHNIVYQKLAGLILLLIMFHLALVLEEFTELRGLVYEYQFIEIISSLFQSVIPTLETQTCIPCVLTIFGIIIASLYGFLVANYSDDGTFQHRQFWLCALLVSIIIAEYSFYAITTLKILPYAAC